MLQPNNPSRASDGRKATLIWPACGPAWAPVPGEAGLRGQILGVRPGSAALLGEGFPVDFSRRFSLLLLGYPGPWWVMLRDGRCRNFRSSSGTTLSRRQSSGGSAGRERGGWWGPAMGGWDAAVGRCCCHRGEGTEGWGDSRLPRTKVNLLEGLKKGHPHFSALLSIESIWKYSCARSNIFVCQFCSLL